MFSIHLDFLADNNLTTEWLRQGKVDLLYLQLTIVVDNGDDIIIGEERGLELSTLETNISKTNILTLEPNILLNSQTNQQRLQLQQTSSSILPTTENQSSVKYAYDQENKERGALASQSKIIDTLMISPGTQKELRKDVDKSEVTNLCKCCFCFH